MAQTLQVSTATGKLDRLLVNAAHTTGKSPLLQLFDKNAKHNFLIDTGAAISVFPAGWSDRFRKGDVTLLAANNSIIDTYGSRQFILDFGLPHPLTNLAISSSWCDSTYHWRWFSVATQIVRGSRQTHLIDTRNGTQVEAEPSPCPTTFLNFLQLAIHLWSFQTTSGWLPVIDKCLHQRYP